ncbi:MAG TPA: DsbA family protein [Longimicrobiaceae bacterium]
MAVQVELFSDFTCPFCHVTEAALRRAAAEAGAVVRYRAFELFPAPAPLPLDAGMEWAEALRPLAEEAGVALGRPGYGSRTGKAHEAAMLAEERGAGAEMRAAIFAAYFAEGRDVGRVDVLVEVGVGIGLDRTELKVVLDVDRFTDAVRSDRDLAARSGIAEVPTLVVGAGPEARVLVGAHPLAALREALAGP